VFAVAENTITAPKADRIIVIKSKLGSRWRIGARRAIRDVIGSPPMRSTASPKTPCFTKTNPIPR
jgi:hypothetical protein